MTREIAQTLATQYCLQDLRGGLVRMGRWFHFRRRVPDALRTVFGRSDIWQALNEPISHKPNKEQQ
ncbi:DUF6538 domain-containing protein [Sphingomonas sp. RB1R13]|uniref:DUF6538 domain-containing protein n=1 Tax=Sphingomonas sp. RB1R13 TaxID=3096159 RepID=UPI003FA70E17